MSDKKPNVFRAWSVRFGHPVYLFGKESLGKYVKRYKIDGDEERIIIGSFGSVGFSHTSYNSCRDMALRIDRYSAIADAIIKDIDRMYYGLAHWNERPDSVKKLRGRPPKGDQDERNEAAGKHT